MIFVANNFAGLLLHSKETGDAGCDATKDQLTI